MKLAPATKYHPSDIGVAQVFIFNFLAIRVIDPMYVYAVVMNLNW